MKLIVFDLDGTLTQTFAVDGSCFVQAFADSLGIKGINTKWSEYKHVTDLGVIHETFMHRFGRPPHADEIARFIDHFVELLTEAYQTGTERFCEVAGASAMLARIAETSEWGLSIATGGWERSAKFKIRSAGLAAQDIPAAFAEDGPSREGIVQTAVVRACTRYHQQAFQRVVLVGDATWDVRTAKVLKMPFLGVGQGDRKNELQRAGASHVIEDFLDQDRWLECLETATIPDAESQRGVDRMPLPSHCPLPPIAAGHSVLPPFLPRSRFLR